MNLENLLVCYKISKSSWNEAGCKRKKEKERRKRRKEIFRLNKERKKDKLGCFWT